MDHTTTVFGNHSQGNNDKGTPGLLSMSPTNRGFEPNLIK